MADKKEGLFIMNKQGDMGLQGFDLYQGDCLDVMKNIPDKSVHMILSDPPYGTTACKWDSIIPLEPMWEHLKRIIKPNGAIVMTASQPFTTVLIASNMKMFKYELIWQKTHPKGHLNAKKQPMRAHENICVFYSNPPTYNPQKTQGHNRKVAKTQYNKPADGNSTYGAEVRNTSYDSTERYPLSVQVFSNADQLNKVHPTQKPLLLMEYLIKTYTNEGEIVLDVTMGSGTTGVACCNLSRKFLGIEKDKKYFKISQKRIKEAIEEREDKLFWIKNE